MDIKLFNVVLMSFGFMFVFTAFQTGANIQKVVIDSIHKEDPSFTGDGYRSLAIIYAVFAIGNWLAPSILVVTGPRGGMFLGSAAYGIFLLTFLWPKAWLLYLTSALLGAGASINWAGQGVYIVKASDPTTITRNSGVFWAIWQMSMFFGNLFVYFQFQGQTHIDKETRQIVYCVLVAVAVAGLICLASLKDPKQFSVIDDDQRQKDKGSILKNAYKEFRVALKLCLTREIFLISVTSIFIGLLTSFFNVYSSSVGFTVALGESAKQLVGLCGVFIGIGEVFGGVTFGLLGKKTVRYGREPVIITGCIISILGVVLTYMNLPHDSPLGESSQKAIIDTPIPFLVPTCAFLLGLADACMNTQMYSLIATRFADKAAVVFALNRFFLSLGAAASFVYSSYCTLTTHAVILIVMAIFGTVSFCMVERCPTRPERDDA